MEILLPVTLGGPSIIAVPALDTIPGSAAATPMPSARESPDVKEAEGDEEENSEEQPQPVAGPSTPFYDARSMTSQDNHGSYFPSGPVDAPSFSAASPSGTSTPNRLRPAPIAIPAATPDEPIFSAYPHTAQGDTSVTRSGSISRGSRTFSMPLKVFALREPTPRRRAGVGDGALESSGESSGSTSLDRTAPPSPLLGKSASEPAKSRRRASTISHIPSPPLTPPTPVSKRRASLAFHVSPSRTLRSLRRRRKSLDGAASGALPKTEYLPTEGEHWPSMPNEVLKRLEPEPTQPFAYAQPTDSAYTLQTISTVATVRPLTPSLVIADPMAISPTIATRRSSLSRVALGLSDVPAPAHIQEGEVVLPEDMTIPHAPPPRRSSMDLSLHASFDLKSLEDSSSIAADVRSLLSSSHATSETCAFSPTATDAHPLSSATTSLSRSAKSGKESEERDAGLNALRLQRSLEWEAKQTRHRRKLEKRKMIILELVETEVAYAEDMRTLVTVYLPQLYALPMISERTADLVARNAKDLMMFHTAFAVRMVDVLRDEQMMYDGAESEDLANKVEKVSRRLSELFLREIEHFAAYNTYCAGSIAASTLVRHIAERADYEAFERRCQIICQDQPHVTLKDLLAVSRPSSASSKNRLHFRDYLIMPIQRVCRYPLLLGSLVDSAPTPSPQLELHPIWHSSTEPSIGVDVEQALGAMRTVAEAADEARRKKDAEVKSATILERMELHPVITPTFLRRLGVCRLIGSLDVLHHHPTVAPLLPPVKVKYLAAFLYRGYLILAKVKKGKIYEAKHFLPLEVFELIDITEGFLPHSIRLTLREHNFDLAASCEAEKEVWAAALVAAREESTVPPFELPASVSPFAARGRRVSITSPPNELSSILSTSNSMKRHTVLGLPEDIISSVAAVEVLAAPADIDSPEEASPTNASPTAVTFGHSDQISTASSILLRRASPAQRQATDRALLDVFSEVCAQARSKAQLHAGLFVPDASAGNEVRDRLSMRDSTMLRRRRSFLDVHHRSNSDISFSGEIKGLVMPSRQPSTRGSRRASTRPTARFRIDDDSSATATEVAGYETGASVSDFGTLRGKDDIPRTESQGSFSSPMPSPRRSFSSLRKAAAEQPPSSRGLLTLNRRKTASTFNIRGRPDVPSRAKSMPVSPVISPAEPPSPLQQSISETLDPSYFPDDHIGPFTPVGGNETPLWQGRRSTAGALPETPEEKGGTWSTLKRNLSFARGRSTPGLGFGVGPDESRLDLADSTAGAAGAAASGTWTPERSNSTSTRAGSDRTEAATPEKWDSPTLAERPAGLLRKKSAKLLRTLGKLTTFEPISSPS